MWKITAGRGNARVADFLEQQLVAIGWSEAGDYTAVRSRKNLIDLFSATWLDQTPRQVQVGAGQVWRFLNELEIADEVVTYDPHTRLYHHGKIVGPPLYQPGLVDKLPVTRVVYWTGAVSRDDLSVGTRNTLGAIMTIFKVSPAAAGEIAERVALVSGEISTSTKPQSDRIDPGETFELVDPFVDIAEQSIERIKDKILSLEWDEMQELVAALLRALGYRTIVSSAGADRGRDIVASRDGFGFEAPRIVVEVKHRRGPMGAPEVRAFLGGRHSEDRGLYVSTGGFTREAQYEAERAATVTHLMTLDGLARALVEQYENLDERGRGLLPLSKLYWPA